MNVSLQHKIKCYEAQKILFAEKASRLAVQKLDLDVESTTSWKVNVWRNHAIEPIVSLCLPYFSYANLQMRFNLSDYDDSLMFADYRQADAELLWLDSSRYLSKISCDDWLDWLIQRINYLRKLTDTAIIIATWLPDTEKVMRLEQRLSNLSMAYLADLGHTCAEVNLPLTDVRSASIAGTSISASAQLLLARKLACKWLPAAMLPPIKAVVLDLDNTLHSGVLGEEGIQGVQLTNTHKAFQLFIKSLQQRGIFIALASRNEKSDVKSLFMQRQDYPLRWDDFSAMEISWTNKADAIGRIAKTLRIAADAMLFVDDNIGELMAVSMQLPQLHTIHASSDAMLTQRTLEHYPGLWRWKIELDDKKRLKDLKANVERDLLLAKSVNTDDYFRSLQVSLTYRYDPLDQLSRLANLSNKTNQFNLSVSRLNQAKLEKYIECQEASVSSVQFQDRLSDSGVIAVIVAQRKGERLLIEELCISCRALGRQLEDTIVLGAIQGMDVFAGCSKVVFRVQRSSRNQPAIDWLKRLFNYENDLQTGLYSVPSNQIKNFVAPNGVILSKV